MVTFQVSDIACGHCASAIAKAVSAVDESARVEVDVPRKRVRVSGEAGCGCGCGSRKPESVEAGQASAPAAGSCCG
ncbi:heavy-metal-associated domain-containing protein [Ramlibacter sp. WS9]|uniref:heavy-metal-associated domain-containing protein n=1 Tax=Ramlibacter sp. WS9 TaxID=1882741 RepID=UPI001143A9E6|nr:heavy-metal-associated domain-containing protein [Ramlibacter sp. WS9]ROZ79581.1 copper chaperone [Ramlibacter sp. WS9]